MSYEIPDVKNVLPKEIFAEKLAWWMEKFHVSHRDLPAICGNKPATSRSTCHRLKHGVTSQKIYLRALPALEEGIERYMNEETDWYGERLENLLNLLFPHRKERDMNIINRCELIAPAIKFFGLTSDPFDVDRVPAEEEMFTNAQLDDIAARVRDAVLYKRFVAVSGAVGTGKTSMKIRVERELRQGKQKVHLIYPEFFDMNAVSVGSIAAYILEEFDIKVPQRATTRVRRIREHLTSLEKDDIRVALVFDECHRLNEKVLISLKNFWEMTNGGYSRLLGVVLFGQPRFVEATLRDMKFREIAERVQVLEIPPLAKSAESYLAHKIAAVGGDINKLFEPQAVKRLCSVAKTPLALGNLANSALMEAFKLEEPRVASSMLNLPDAPKVRNIRQAA